MMRVCVASSFEDNKSMKLFMSSLANNARTYVGLRAESREFIEFSVASEINTTGSLGSFRSSTLSFVNDAMNSRHFSARFFLPGMRGSSAILSSNSFIAYRLLEKSHGSSRLGSRFLTARVVPLPNLNFRSRATTYPDRVREELLQTLPHVWVWSPDDTSDGAS